MEPIPVPSEPTTRPSTHFTPLDDLTSSFLLNAKIQTYAHQYSSIYFLRLHEMKKAVSQVARAKWANAPGGPQHVARVLDIKKGKLCYVIGTVYMEMRMKPSILDDIVKDEFNLAAPPTSKYFSDDDAVNLEDESGRVKLVGEVIAKAGIVTGIIIGALGMETPAGDFEVVDYCFAGLPPQSPLSGSALSKSDKMDIDGEPSSSSSGEWIALVSGLEIGLTNGTAADAEFLETSRQLLIEFLLGEAGGVEDQAFSSQISRLIILGNSVVPIILEEEDEAKSKRFNASKTKYDPTPLYTLSSILTEISRALPTHILPGSSDPTGTSLPQQPLPRPMFGKELSSKGKEAFVCETNPTWIGVGDCEMLAISGQTIEDIYKYVDSPTRLEMATRTLLWRHMAPTAPDTLWCYPYLNEDPFILTRCPHIYVLGNQPEFQTDIVEGTEGQRTRIILLPKFSETGCLTLVNTNSLEVKTISFKVSAP